MSYSDDPTTDIGKVRTLVPDHVSAGSAHFSDEDLQVFLDLESDVRLAAASACEAWASELAIAEHNVTLGDYREDTKGRANTLLARAQRLRTATETTPAFAIASPAVDGPLGFQGRDRLVNAALTGELG